MPVTFSFAPRSVRRLDPEPAAVGDAAVANDETLASVLSEFARTMITDFPIQRILDRLVERIVDVLPVTAAGVTLIAPGAAPRYIAASDDSALAHEKLQTDLGLGPCLLAYDSGEAVSVPDVVSDDRFGPFGPAAAATGLAAVFAFPLRHGSELLGALDLYRDVPGPLDPHDMDTAQTLADVVAAYLLNARARDEAQETADRYRESSLHDSLTGLPNRVLLQKRLEHAARRALRSHTDAAVLFADLDHFKRVNDTYGHPAGDQLLVAVAQRLSRLVRPGDTLARVAGDEFVFLCEDLVSADYVEVLAMRIGSAFKVPFTIDGTEVSATASIGMAYSGPGEEISDQLIADADMAMYQAKRKGGGSHQILDLREAQQIGERHDLERDLRAAFARGDLDIAYQPVVRCTDGQLVGVEALLRWVDPQRGVVSPLEMIGVAEQSGLITQIGAWVLETSCGQRERWLHQHPDSPLELAVNISARQLMSPDFCGSVALILLRTRMDPGALILEMTEGIFLDDAARAATVLSDLKALGVRLALDDFGTGYSSLSYLSQFPVDIVKIDQGFIARIVHDPTAAAVVESVTRLSHVLGLSVTAEGVETAEQRDSVITLGCELAQGFLFDHPMSARHLSEHLRASPDSVITLPSLVPVHRDTHP
jgi:diguanylate cyclase (GGDEF)-like protein